MWNQACSQSPGGMTRHKAGISKRATLQILPCTVSQLLSASQVSNDTFTMCDWELNQVSLVGIVRGFAPFVTNVQYSVDDMTGPPLSVKQWVNTEDCALTLVSPGTYVKVTGSLRSFNGQRSMLAMDIRCIKDLNEITSHMLEVVQAHMQLFGKAFDVNMNPTAVPQSGRVFSHGGGGHPEGVLPNSLSTIQGQVLHVIRRFSVHVGISLRDLKIQLDHLSIKDIRDSLVFLVNEGHVFTTIDDHHFKSPDQ
ncbi:replication protein A 32 kDa subunit-like [Morone saxatilis]|uniref:replication protein A 32 kDa subunit-like n=1 Tax=Morone saxatilis TaxID=34816 RepID=UPI0015E202DD|nr:replication protein A 32 kDa subunit-like [Morone saxatilis]